MKTGSIDTAKAALKMAISTRDEEKQLKEELSRMGIAAAAVDFGGEFNKSLSPIIERTVVAARREGVISESHVHQGAVSGAIHDALSQIAPRAMGLNIGGKIGIARSGEHLVVAAFFGVGMLNLNEVAVGLSHRSVPEK